MMRNPRVALAAITVAVWIGACAKGEQASQHPDSTARNLTLAPADTNAARHDVAAPASRATQTKTPASAPAKPRAPATYTVTAGTHIDMAVTDTLSSRTNHAGDGYTAHVVDDVTANGHDAIPLGSTVEGTIVAVKQAPNPSTPGTLTLSVASITVRGTRYPVVGTVDSLETVRQGRGVTKGDAAKVGVGAAAGAILGRVLGGNAKGTVIGGVVGAAAGAGVAAATKNADIVLPAGAHIHITITQPLTVKAQ